MVISDSTTIDLELSGVETATHALLDFMIFEVGLRGSVILLVGALLCTLIGRRTATQRSALWYMLICALALMPLLHRLIPEITVPLIVGENWRYLGSPSALVELARSAPGSILALLYSGVLVLNLLTLAVNLLRLRALSRHSVAVTDPELLDTLDLLMQRNGIGSSVRLGSSDRISSPLTFGILRHRIIMPATYRNWKPEVLRQCLSHELAHIQRMDWLGQLLSRVVLSVYWLNPLAWLLQRQYIETCEKACDEAVVDETGNAVAYAENLLWIARNMRLKQPRGLNLASKLLGSRSLLHRRIQHILCNDLPHFNNGRDSLIAGVVFALILVAVPASLRVSLHEQELLIAEPELVTGILYQVKYYPRGSGEHDALAGQFERP